MKRFDQRVSKAFKAIFVAFTNQVEYPCTVELMRALQQQGDSGMCIDAVNLPHVSQQAAYMNAAYSYYMETVIPHKVAVYKEGMAFYARHRLHMSKKESNMFYHAREAIDKLRGMNGNDEFRKFHDRLILHDLSKFSLAERGYVEYDFKKGAENSEFAVNAFYRAWHHHARTNSHHPEYFIQVGRDAEISRIHEMELLDIMEMYADWLGAGETYGTPFKEWALGNLATFRFGEKTADVLKAMLEKEGYRISSKRVPKIGDRDAFLLKMLP